MLPRTRAPWDADEDVDRSTSTNVPIGPWTKAPPRFDQISGRWRSSGRRTVPALDDIDFSRSMPTVTVGIIAGSIGDVHGVAKPRHAGPCPQALADRPPLGAATRSSRSARAAPRRRPRSIEGPRSRGSPGRGRRPGVQPAGAVPCSRSSAGWPLCSAAGWPPTFWPPCVASTYRGVDPG